MAKLVRHLTSNEEIVSSNLAEGIIFLLQKQTVSHCVGNILIIDQANGHVRVFDHHYSGPNRSKNNVNKLKSNQWPHGRRTTP